jgi:hypothetical protein
MRTDRPGSYIDEAVRAERPHPPKANTLPV